MLESAIVRSILAELKPLGWFVKIHGGPYQSAGIPDIIGVMGGRFVAIEVKRPGEVPTPIQRLVMRRIAEAGGIVGVATSVAEARAIIEDSLKETKVDGESKRNSREPDSMEAGAVRQPKR